MIRFACPGCGATYSVEDSKGGKAGKCPKCGAQFLIPTAAAAEAPPPPGYDPTATTAFPPRPLPPPRPAPPPPAPREVEIKPCPKCGARLSVAPADLGTAVECPYCQAVYTARKPGAAEPERPSRRPRDEDRPSRRQDEEEDRPRGRRPRDDDEEDRPSRRRRDEDDAEENRPRRRKRFKRRSGAVDTVARLNYVLGGLALLCGFCIVGAGTVAGAAFKNAANRPGAKPLPVDPDALVTLMLVVGAMQVLLSFLLIAGGVGLGQRAAWGRVLTFITAGLGLLFGALYLVSIVLNAVNGNIAGAAGALLACGIWGGYGITAMNAMIKCGDEFE